MQFTYLHTIDKAYAGIAITMASISILSCIFIICVLTSFTSLRTNGRMLLVCLSVASIISSVASIIAASVSVFTPVLNWNIFPVCAAASSISIVSNVCAYLWTCAISLYVYLCISWKKMEFADKSRCAIHVICWGFPVAVMVIATVSDVVGFDFGKAKIERRPPWCWIDRDSDKFIMWELVTGLGWRIATIVFCTAVYSHIQFSLSVQAKSENPSNSTSEDDQTHRIQLANRKLRHIPLIFVVLNACGAWQEMASALSSTPSWLVLMQVLGDHSQGFVNAILLCCLTTDVRKKLYIKCQSVRHFVSGRPSCPLPLELVELNRSRDNDQEEMDEIDETQNVQG